MKLRVCLFLPAVLVALVFSGCLQKSQPQVSSKEKAKPYKVGVVFTAPHAVIDDIVAGFKETLVAELGDQKEAVVYVEHANGDWAQFGATIDSVLSKELDLIVPITTPVSQNALKRASASVPVCFLGVTDPIGAGLVDDLESTQKKCTGVSDLAPFEAILGFIRKEMPAAKSIGFPYNPEDQPAMFGLAQVKKFAPGLGFKVDARPVTSQDEILTLVNDICQSNDCILIGSDNLMFEMAPTIVKAALNSKTPVFAGDNTSIKAGAVGGFTIDYRTVGVEGAKLAKRILAGEKVNEIPCVVLKNGVLEINLTSAKKFGIELSEETRKAAKTVYE